MASRAQRGRYQGPRGALQRVVTLATRLTDLDIQTFSKDGGTWRITSPRFTELLRELPRATRSRTPAKGPAQLPRAYDEAPPPKPAPSARGCQRIARLVLRNLGKRTSVSYAGSCSFRLHVQSSSLLSPNSLEQIVCACSPIDTVAAAAVFYEK